MPTVRAPPPYLIPALVIIVPFIDAHVAGVVGEAADVVARRADRKPGAVRRDRQTGAPREPERPREIR